MFVLFKVCLNVSLLSPPHLSGVWFVAEGCPQIATCGVTRRGCTSARRQTPNLPLHSGRGSVQPCYRIMKAADAAKTILDLVSLRFAALRCLTGLSTTASLGGQTEKAGNTQLIFQRMFQLFSYSSFMRFFSFVIPQYLDPCPSPPCLCRSYHSCKTMKDFVRRRRWARYYLKKKTNQKKKTHTHADVCFNFSSAE